MEEALAVLRRGLTTEEADEALVLLAAMGFAVELETEPDGTAVRVPATELARATAALAELDEERAESSMADDRSARRGGARAAARALEGALAELPPHALRRGFAVVAGLVALCTGVFLWTTRGAPQASYARMLEMGAISSPRVDDGEVWRLATAVFLHFDLAHLIANVAVLILVGPLLAALLGPLRFLVVFVGAGVAGNAVSYALAPAVGLRAGASGAVAGVLGALAGQALVEGRRGRFRPWQIAAAIAAVYALLVGAGPRSDHLAHLAGLLSGIVLGRLLAPAVPGAQQGGQPRGKPPDDSKDEPPELAGADPAA